MLRLRARWNGRGYLRWWGGWAFSGSEEDRLSTRCAILFEPVLHVVHIGHVAQLTEVIVVAGAALEPDTRE